MLTDEMWRVMGALQGLERGTLRVAASSTPGLYVLPPLLARFQQDYPGKDCACGPVLFQAGLRVLKTRHHG